MMWKPDTRKAGLMRMNLLPRSMNIALEFAYQVAPRTFKWQACPSIADHCKILQVEGWIRCSNRRIDGLTRSGFFPKDILQVSVCVCKFLSAVPPKHLQFLCVRNRLANLPNSSVAMGNRSPTWAVAVLHCVHFSFISDGVLMFQDSMELIEYVLDGLKEEQLWSSSQGSQLFFKESRTAMRFRGRNPTSS